MFILIPLQKKLIATLPTVERYPQTNLIAAVSTLQISPKQQHQAVEQAVQPSIFGNNLPTTAQHGQ
jgi:hypothetical protein